MDMEALWDEFPEMKEDLMRRRMAGVTLHSRRLLEARKPKTGDVCKGSAKTTMSSRDYPSSGQEVMVRYTTTPSVNIFETY
jgi:hypothetical protein